MCVAIAVSVAVGAFAFVLIRRPHVTQDFEFYWRAVRLWVFGVDPYTVGAGSLEWPLPDRLFYPLPALLVVWPLHTLSQPIAGGLFLAVPAGLLAWRLSRIALWPLLALATPSFVMAVVLGQWSPWLMLAILSPAFGVMLACKPTLGLACFAPFPSWRATLGVVGILLLSFILWPGWVVEWLDNLRSIQSHPAPLFTPMGGLLALSALRWRRNDARLLPAFACVPQLLFFANQLPLMLVAHSRREAALLAIGGWIAVGFWFVRESTKYGAVEFAAPYVLAGCYLPALWIVLRRPNEGPLPAWLEHRIVQWPAWLRGASVHA